MKSYFVQILLLMYLIYAYEFNVINKIMNMKILIKDIRSDNTRIFSVVKLINSVPIIITFPNLIRDF